MKLWYISIQWNECITVHVENKTYTNTHTRMIISYQFEIIPVMVHINIVACECNQNMTKLWRCNVVWALSLGGAHPNAPPLYCCIRM